MEDYNKIHMPMYSFIPKPLEIEGKPHLSVFPYNVMIMRYKTDEAGNLISGKVIYNPDFESYRETSIFQSMLYQNSYGSGSGLFILYDKLRKSYIGVKYLKGECVGESSGMNWNDFFIHIGKLGIANGEPCEFQFVQPWQQQPMPPKKTRILTDPLLEYFKKASEDLLKQTGEHEPLIFCHGSKGNSRFSLNKFPSDYNERIRAVEWQGYNYARDPKAREHDGYPKYIFFVGITWESIYPEKNIKNGQIIKALSGNDPNRKEVLTIWGNNMAIDFYTICNREIIRDTDGSIIGIKGQEIPEGYCLMKCPFLDAFIAGYKAGRLSVSN